LAIGAACGGASAPAPSPSAAGTANEESEGTLSPAEAQAMCVQLHQEAARCPLEFTLVNLELRAKYVPEMAAALADPAQRAAIEAQGVEETKADGAAAEARCAEFIKPEWGPPTPKAAAAAAQRCYQQPDCSARMGCLRAVIEPRYQYRAVHAPPQDAAPAGPP
jgi:hypothetical protein